MSLIAEKILEIADLVGTAKMLGMYMLTVMVYVLNLLFIDIYSSGLAIQLFVILPIVFFVATRHNPFTFLKAMSQAALTALGTASR